MICEHCNPQNENNPYSNFNKIITNKEFVDLEKENKKEIISNFIYYLIQNEIKKSFHKNITKTLEKSIKDNLFTVFKNVEKNSSP